MQILLNEANRPFLQLRGEVMGYLRTELPGKNLYDLAGPLGITVRKEGRLNKGWVGQTIEKIAGLSTSNAQRPDGLDFELKSTTVVRDGDNWRPRETIKITQLTPRNLLTETFETSAMWNKLSRFILVGCEHESETVCRVVHIGAVDLNAEDIVSEIRTFWMEIQQVLFDGELADFPFPGTFEDYVQLRPTGTGKHSSTCPITGRKFPAMAFYGTKRLISRVLSSEGL